MLKIEKGRKPGKISPSNYSESAVHFNGFYSGVKPVNGIKHSTMDGNAYQKIFANIKPSQEKILFLQIGLSRWKVGFNLYSRSN